VNVINLSFASLAEIKPLTKETLISHSNDAVFILALVAYNSMIYKHWLWFILKLEVEDTTLSFLLCLLYFNHWFFNLWLRLLFYIFFFYSLIFLIDFLLHQLSDSLLQLTGYDIWIHRDVELRKYIFSLGLLDLNLYFLRNNLNRLYLNFYFLDEFHFLFLHFYFLFSRLLNLLFKFRLYPDLYFFLGLDINEDLLAGVVLRLYFFEWAVVDFKGWLDLVGDLDDLGEALLDIDLIHLDSRAQHDG